MKKQYLSILMLPALLFTSCKWSMIDPDVETPSINVRLSESSPSTEIIISWNKCDDAQGYGITRTFTRDGVTDEVIYSYISTDTTSYTDSTCEPGVEYTYTVTAGYFKGKGLFFGRVFGDLLEASSEAKTIKTQVHPLVVLDHPKNLVVSQIPGKTNSLELSWTACEGAEAYEIYRNNSIQDKYREYKLIETVDSNKCQIDHLYNESEYRFKIKAIGARGKSSVFSLVKGCMVPEAINTNLQNAYVLENGVTEHFYTDKGTLWFVITPQKGLIKMGDCYLNGKCISLCDENGDFIVPSLYLEERDDMIYAEIPENKFEAGKSYFLQIWNPGNIKITVE